MLTFAQPAFLLALAGLVLPVLIHRISRAQARPWWFPSIQLIRKAPLPRQGSRRISDWLLLLLRMLLFTLLVLGLAGPRWQAGAEGTDTAAGQTVVVLDLSSSMGGWDALPAARAAVKERLDGLAANERVGFVLFDKEVRNARPPGPEGRDFLGDRLREAESRTVTGDPGSALREAMNLFAADAGSASLIIVSDFQAVNWEDASLPALPPGVETDLLPVGEGRERPNLAVTEVRTVPVGEAELRVVVRIRNFSTTAAEAEVRLRTSSRKGSQPVSVDAGATETVSFRIPLPEGSPEGVAEVAAGADPYAADDAFSFWAAEPPAATVLALLPGDASQGDAEEVFFLEQALGAVSEHEWLGFSLVPIGMRGLPEQTLARASAVFLPSGRAAAEATPWASLADYLEAGGTVLATLDAGAVRALRAMRNAGLPGVSYRGRTGLERDARLRFHIGEFPKGSPLKEVFSGPAERDLYLLELTRHVRLEAPGEATVLLQSEEGAPLLLSLPHGKGRLYLSAFPWNREASDLPLRAAFLPIVRELLATAVPPDGGIENIATHTDLAGTQPGRTAEPGVFYHEGRPVQVNVSRAESDPARIDLEALRTRLSGGPSAAAGGEQAVLAGSGERTFGPFLLLAALLVWIVESLLARVLSRST